MASGRARASNKRRKKSGSPNSNKAVDRISALPDELIHHILTFIPTIEAVQLSLLSRRWRHAWLSVPSLHFDKFDEPFDDTETSIQFNMFVEECLKRRLKEWRRLDTASTMTSFYLSNDKSLSPYMADAMTRLLSSRKSIDSIKELNLLFPWCSSPYCLPAELLNSTSLSVLDLIEVELPDVLNCSVNLPSLTSLSLQCTSMCDGILTRFLSGCPSLQRLRMINCSGIENPNFFSSSLESLIFWPSDECKAIRIEAVNLKCLELDLDGALPDISTCEIIRDLRLRDCVVDDKLLSDIEHKFTCLESLEFETCSTPEEIAVRSRSLEKFTICKLDDVKLEATFETPNLVEIDYEGDLNFNMYMNPPNDRLNGTVRISSHEDNFYSGLFEFASTFCWSSNNMLTLVLSSKDVYLIARLFMKDSNGRPMWPDLKHMKVNQYEVWRGISKLKSALEYHLFATERNRSLETPISQAIYKILKDHPNRYKVNKEMRRLK